MGMNTSSKTLNLQSSLKATEINSVLHSEYVKRKKNWSDRPTSLHCLSFGEGLFVQQYARALFKDVRRITDRRFELRFNLKQKVLARKNASFGGDVVHGGLQDSVDSDAGDMDVDDFDEFKNVPIPLFHRIRYVDVDKDGVMHCSCCKFERCGHFCADQIAVAEFVHAYANCHFKGFTHHDVAMRYWIVFMHMAYKSSTPQKILDCMHSLCNNKVKGPRLRVGIPECIPIEEPSPVRSALDRLKNYDASSIDLSKVDGMHCFTYSPPLDDQTSPDFLSFFETMMEDVIESTPESFGRWFQVSADDDGGTHVSAKSSSARTRLRPFVDSAYKLADRLGESAHQHLEEKLSEFNDWCSVQLAEKDAKKNTKRKYIPFSQEEYEGNAKRVFNTHHM